MRLLRPLSLAVFALSIPVVVSAQGGRGGGEPPKNLQVLPKDTPRNQVTAIMRTFAMALGVRCEHCHAPAAAAANPDTAPAGRGGRGGGGPQLDYSLDDKETKKVAREMIKGLVNVTVQERANVQTMADGGAFVELTLYIPKERFDAVEAAATPSCPMASWMAVMTVGEV